MLTKNKILILKKPINMKLLQVKRWKHKQKMFNQKYKLKNLKKSERTRDFSGKFLFLFSRKNICTILKFISKKVCVTETALIIDESFIKQVSKKLIITSKYNKKVLQELEVRISQKFKESMLKLVKVNRDSNRPDMKKYTCEICLEQFSSLIKLESHIDTLHELESEGESISEDLVIDDDVELVLDDGDDSYQKLPPKSSIANINKEFPFVS